MKEVYYIRHNWEFSGPADFCRKKKYVGMHWKNKSSVKPSEYDDLGKRAFERLYKALKSGALVCADYPAENGKRDKRYMLIGKLDVNKSVFSEKVKCLEGPTWWLKCARLEKPLMLPYSSHPSLLSRRPTRGTIMKWPSMKQYVNRIVKNGHRSK